MGKYIKQSTHKNEKLIYEAKISSMVIAPAIIWGIVLFLSLIISLALNDWSTFVVVFFICIILCFPLLIKKYTTELGFTNKRLIGKVGLINTKSLDSPLNKINNVSVSRNLFGRMFKYGRITISTSSGTYNYVYILNPEKFRNKLLEQMEILDDERIKLQAKEVASNMSTMF